VTNPIPRLTGAIHVDGGDFFAVERSEWDPETLREQPYDVAKAIRLFEESNNALAPSPCGPESLFERSSAARPDLLLM
jgi:hypothetical protein